MGGAHRMLAGRYALGEVVGHGGMATVYRARDHVLDRTVAVKVLSAALVEHDARSAARFEREARVVAALSHRCIVKVFDSGVDEQERFIVMEHVCGRSLAAVLRQRGRLPAKEAMAVSVQIADALASIHAAGLVHRDLKPSNAMIEDDGKVKLLDFGIAFAPASTALTQTSAVFGSAPYMAPEQASGGRGGASSDIYALGCLLYELLDGRPPFTAAHAAAVLHQHLHAAPRRVSMTAQLPVELDALVMQMLAKRRQARPGSAVEVRDRIASIVAARNGGDDERPTVQVESKQRTRRQRVARTLRYSQPRRPSRRLAFPIAVVAGVCAATALVLGFTLSGAGESSPSGSSRPPDGSSSITTVKAQGNDPHARHSSSAKVVSTARQDARKEGVEATRQTHAGGGLFPSGTSPRASGAPAGGRSGSQQAPLGHGGLPPGHRGAPLLHSGGPPEHDPPSGHHGVPPGHGGTPPGHGGTPPGHGGTPPGHGGVPPGHRAG